MINLVLQTLFLRTFSDGVIKHQIEQIHELINDLLRRSIVQSDSLEDHMNKQSEFQNLI